jgi:hypothetical protein
MRQATRLLSAALIASLVGCALPAHNNTLIFAVHRKVGIDITPTNATNAGLTIGYSSNEFAWVPLWANDRDGKPMTPCYDNTTTSEDKKITTKSEQKKCPEGLSPKFVGTNAEGGGKSNKDEDAYSTFASFGGDIRADAANTNAGIKLASFFATGIAAQHLAEQGSSLTAVSDAYSATKAKLSAAVQQAKTNLFELFKLIAIGDDKNAKVPEKCLTVIGTEFDSKQENRFDYLKDSAPLYAASNLTTFNFSDDEYRKLGGIAYRHAANIETRLDKKQSDDKQWSKDQVARAEMNCRTGTDPVAKTPAPAASAPATPASSPAVPASEAV